MMHIMRYPEGHKEAMRERIVQAAAKALRRHGLAGVSIPALMKRAGLTHGGFYVHFKNRDELVASAVVQAAEGTGAAVFRDEHSLADALRLYLSTEHVARPAEGCVVAALGSDGPRQPAPVRRAFGVAARGLIALVDRKLTGRTGMAVSDAALVQTAAMVGAVMLARLVDDPELEARMLAAVRALPATLSVEA